MRWLGGLPTLLNCSRYPFTVRWEQGRLMAALVAGLTFVTKQAVALVAGLAFITKLARRLGTERFVPRALWIPNRVSLFASSFNLLPSLSALHLTKKNSSSAPSSVNQYPVADFRFPHPYVVGTPYSPTLRDTSPWGVRPMPSVASKVVCLGVPRAWPLAANLQAGIYPSCIQ